ncbi:chondroitin AC/alginate lyase [Thamnidium elegans]|nr:chondroitin AC/alginate lyase [Thamnidium elegans]
MIKVTLLLSVLTGFVTCLTVQEDIQTLYDRKIDFIIQDGSANINQIPTWMNTFSLDNGTWSDVDYTTGCDARRANWPAQQHFQRIVTLATQFRTSAENNSSSLLPPISKALDYWFDHNYVPDTCLDQGGLENSTCPCGTPGFWNTNWFGQMILMPKLISNACLLLKQNLTQSQLSNCTHVVERVYSRIDTVILGIGPMTGANMLDSSTSILNLALLTDNVTLASDALNRFYNQTLITTETGVDGVKVDGSYLQHFAQLYNGNYGKDFINSVVNMYLQTANTSFSPPPDSQSSFLTMMNGTEWMIVSSPNNTLLWEYSVIGRMVSFIAADKQASGGVALNLTRINLSTSDWPNATSFRDIVQDLNDLQDSSTPGQGRLNGTRGFYTSDFLVHRSPSYVTTFKAFSTRTSNSECNNDQNPYGFHLSDGAIYSYIEGDEYKDVFAAWDWNLVPGTTVDYGATPFGCNITQFYGNASFVGSVTPSLENGFSSKGGMAVMQYINPMTGSLRWEKTFYFFPGFYAVQIGPIESQGDVEIITTLDQSNLKGQVLTTENTVWHNKILYTILDDTVTLKINTDSHAANNWSTIGISQGVVAQPIFTATLQHSVTSNSTNPVSYVAQLGVDQNAGNVSSIVQLVHQDDQELGKVRGAYNVRDQTIALAFWTPGTFVTEWDVTVKTDQAILTFFTKEESGYIVTVSDPTQLLTQVQLEVTVEGKVQQLNIILPSSPFTGSSVSYNLLK